jgi:hypothetical protein
MNYAVFVDPATQPETLTVCDLLHSYDMDKAVKIDDIGRILQVMCRNRNIAFQLFARLDRLIDNAIEPRRADISRRPLVSPSIPVRFQVDRPVERSSGPPASVISAIGRLLPESNRPGERFLYRYRGHHSTSVAPDARCLPNKWE